MTVADLIRLRSDLGLTQSAMAQAMGLKLRGYQDIEAAPADEPLNVRHRLLAERCSLSIAVERRAPMLALPVIRREAQAIMALWEGTA